VWFSTRMLTSLPGNWSRRTLHLEELYSKQNQSNCSPRNSAERSTSTIPLPIPIGLADQASAHLEPRGQEYTRGPVMHARRAETKRIWWRQKQKDWARCARRRCYGVSLVVPGPVPLRPPASVDDPPAQTRSRATHGKSREEVGEYTVRRSPGRRRREESHRHHR